MALLLPTIEPKASVKDPYSFYVDCVIQSKMLKHSELLYQDIQSAYNNCFIYAKTGDWAVAEESLEIGNDLIKKMPLDLLPLVEVFCKPYISYYYYKKKDFNKAIDLTHSIISQAIYLERNGYEYLFFARIQQYHNLSRIYFVMEDRDRLDDVLEICEKCVKEIHAKGMIWKEIQMLDDIISRELLEATIFPFFIQIIGETCNRVIKSLEDDTLRLNVALRRFVNPLLYLDYASINRDNIRYRHIDTFFSVINRLIELDLVDGDLSFIEDKAVDRSLKIVLYNYLAVIQV